jgi:hypothetical protein
MDEFPLAYEPSIRFSVFLGVFAAMAAWEALAPRRARSHGRLLRWPSNFAFNLSIWDRIFGTYRDQPATGREAMTIGIEQFREERELWLARLLPLPFRGQAGAYPINRR